MAKGEIHIELPVNFADDPKVRALARWGKDARSLRDLWVQTICFCKETLSDGFVPSEQLGILVYPDSPKIGERDALRLVEVGLLEVVDGGYRLPKFLKRNKSRDQVHARIQQKHDAGVLSNHKRWHVARGISDPLCDHCAVTPPITPDIGAPIGPTKGTESTETETETETETTPSPHPLVDNATDANSEPPNREEEADPKTPQPDRLAALVAEVRQHRPTWTERSIRHALTQAANDRRPYNATRHALLALARGDHGPTNAPGRLNADGPWWNTPAPRPPNPQNTAKCDRVGHEYERLPCRACAAEALESATPPRQHLAAVAEGADR